MDNISRLFDPKSPLLEIYADSKKKTNNLRIKYMIFVIVFCGGKKINRKKVLSVSDINKYMDE